MAHSQARTFQLRAQTVSHGPFPHPHPPSNLLDQKPDHCPVTHMQTSMPSRQGLCLSGAGAGDMGVCGDTGLRAQVQVMHRYKQPQVAGLSTRHVQGASVLFSPPMGSRY